MKYLDVEQGSDVWRAIRAAGRPASEAPIIMGASPYMSRADALRMRATGGERDHTDHTLRLFARGHEIEAASLPLAEAIIGDEVFPGVGESDDGYLMASFDGITLDGSAVWECKSWNDTKAAAVNGGVVPAEDYWQVVQQLAVSGAARCLYMVSDGEREVHLWVSLQDGDEAKLRAGWGQWDEDVANYSHTEYAPDIIAAAPDALPTLTVEISGSVVASNLVTWKSAMIDRIQAINTDLRTDEDFSVAEKTVKFLDEGEKRLDLVKSQALAQTASIDELFRTIDSLREEMRAKRLTLDKLVKARKDAVRAEIIAEGRSAMDDHVKGLNQRLGVKWMPAQTPNFAGAIKGLKTIQSVRDAVAHTLASAKIDTNAIADKIQINLAELRKTAKGHETLFPDAQLLCVTKDHDDLMAIIKQRIADHKEAALKRTHGDVIQNIPQQGQTASPPAANYRTAETPALGQRETAQDDGRTIMLGELCDLLEFTVTAKFLAGLGFHEHGRAKRAILYRACDVPAICVAIAAHVAKIGREAAQPTSERGTT